MSQRRMKEGEACTPSHSTTALLLLHGRTVFRIPLKNHVITKPGRHLNCAIHRRRQQTQEQDTHFSRFMCHSAHWRFSSIDNLTQSSKGSFPRDAVPPLLSSSHRPRGDGAAAFPEFD